MTELTQELLKELFDYQDGNLHWKVGRQGRKLGVPAGTLKKSGYRSIIINYKSYYAHRLIFLYHHGYLPEFLDHIDGNPSNNNITNLREATYRQNAMNQKKFDSMNGKPTSSEYKGVCWFKRVKKWVSYIHINGKRKHLGYYDSEIGAAKDYNRAASKDRGKFARINNIGENK